MTKAYRIVNWKPLYEVTGRGKKATEETALEDLRKSKLPYVRWAVHGHSLGPTYRKMVKKAWGVGILMEMACMGLFGKMLELAADQGPKWRGWILDEKQRPINAPQIAELLDIKDDGTVGKLIEVLCHEEINWVELVEFPLQAGVEGGEVGESGGRLGGESEEPLYKVTETEEEGKVIETESDLATGGGEVLSPAPCPPSMVTGSVSDVSASDSVSAAGRGQGIKKRRAIAVLELSRIIPARNNSDQTTFRDIFDQLEERMVYDTNEPLFDKAIEKARGCRQVGRVPASIFVAAMKKSPFCYVPKGTSLIKGQTDKYHR